MRDLLVEAFLKERGVEFEYREGVPVDDIDAERSLKNQARVGGDGALIEELVEEYARAMKQGCHFPALVGWIPPGQGLIELCGGNQRLHAFPRARVRKCDVYVLHTKDRDVAADITRRLNNLNGMRQTAEQNLAHAVELVISGGESVKTAARRYNLPSSRLQIEVRIRHVRDRLIALGVPEHHVPKRLLRAMDGITNDPALRAVADFIITAQIDGQDAEQLFDAVKAQRSEGEMLRVVEEWRRRQDMAERVAAGTDSSPGKRAPRSQLFRFVVGLQNLLQKHGTSRAFGLSREDRRDLLHRYCVFDPILREVLDDESSNGLAAGGDGSVAAPAGANT